jgi:hypothetical protein
MPAEALEERVALLEADMLQLKRQLAQNKQDRAPWWEQIAGTFADDPAFEEATRLGQQYRAAQHPDVLDAPDDHVSA